MGCTAVLHDPVSNRIDEILPASYRLARQLRVKKSRYLSQGNCFEYERDEQLVAHLDYRKRYGTLAEYQLAVNQDTDSSEECGRLPKKIKVRRLHAKTLAYPERARTRLARRSQ